jgi:hypothetical protein
MVGTVSPIYRGEKSLPRQGIRARYRGRPGRARGGQNNRRIAQLAEYFCEEARGIGTFSGKPWAVRCPATAFRSPCRHFCLDPLPNDPQELVQAKPGLLGQVIWPSSAAIAAATGRGGGGDQ